MTRWLLLSLAACGAPEPPRFTAPRTAVPAQQERTWRPVATPAPFTAAAPLLLTDGTVMIQDLSTNHFWRLTPDEVGSYEYGTWSQRGDMPAGYTPLYYASAVLPDGRVIAQGGEYIDGVPTWSTRGALYDPIADQWISMPPPVGWTMIGDASGVVLPGGQFLLSSCCTSAMALFDARSLTYQQFGQEKLDIHDEESWALLPDGTILTVDANNLSDLKATEIFDPGTGLWHFAGDTPVQISDTNPDNSGSHEVGPNVLRHDGTVLAIGGNGHNAIYNLATKTWSTAPDLPMVDGRQLDVADGPAAVLPNGDVLLLASPGVFETPSSLYEWNGTTFVDAPPTAHCAGATSYQFAMLVLPTGEILMTDYSSDVELYTPAHGVIETAVPVITGIGEPDGGVRSGSQDTVIELYPGRTYELAGHRLAGISQGGYYGDDVQTATNFPLVRLTMAATGRVMYLRTHDHSSVAIGSDTNATTKFDVPAAAEPGLATLEVVANGISSPPITVDAK